MKNKNRYRLNHTYRRLCCYSAIFLFAVLGLSNIVLAGQSNQDQVRAQLEDLYEKKNEVDKVISGLNGKPAQMQVFQKTLVENYKYLARQNIRLEGIQLWNGFVGFIGVAFDCLQKVNPGSSAVVALATFVQDRATQTLSNANLEASINSLSGEIKGVDVSLRMLDRALKMNAAEVADQMVATGMVKDIDSLVVRWDFTIRQSSTPEELAKSAAVVTAKNTFIRERIGPAMKSLYHARIAAGKSIIAIAEHLTEAKKKSRELGLQIAKLEGKIEFEEIKADSSYEPALNIQPDITSDVQPKRHSHAFADIQSAWGNLRANTINGHTYTQIKSRMQAASLLYGQQQMKPFSKEFNRTRDYMLNELAAATRAISDHYTRVEFHNRKIAEFDFASDQFFKAQDEQRKERTKEFFEPLKRLHEEELGEKARLKGFCNRAKALYNTPVTSTRLDNNLEVQTWTAPLNALITSENLANAAWAGLIGPRLPISFQGNDKKAASLARKAITKAENLLSGAEETASQMGAIIGKAEAMASELESNLELWNYLTSASDLPSLESARIPSEWLPAITVSSKIFNAQVNLLRSIAKTEYESLKEEATRVIQTAGVKGERKKQIEKAKTVLANWVKAKNTSANTGLNSQRTTTKNFLQQNNLNQDRIQKIEKIITQLEKAPDNIENYVLKELAGGKRPDWLVPDAERLKVIQGQYTQLKSGFESSRIAYPEQYTTYNESLSQLEESLYAAQSRYTTSVPSLAASFSMEAIMAEAGQHVQMNEWTLPDPADLPEQDPADDALIQNFIDMATRYNELIDPYTKKAQDRYKTALVTMKVLSRKPLTTAVLQYDISPEAFEKRVSDIAAQAKEIYEPLAFLDGDSVTTDFGVSYQAFMDAISQAQEQYLVSWIIKIDRKLETIHNDLQADKISDPTIKDRYVKELHMLIAPDSFADRLLKEGHRRVNYLIVRIEDLIEQLTRPQSTDNYVAQIKEFYNQFKEAYESKDEYQVVSLICDDWGANDGSSLSDLEDNLHNMFAVFDEIQYTISELSIQRDPTKTYRVSYTVAIMGRIYESDITHTEKSSVQELVKIENGTVKIVKTLNGNFWSIE
jgi:hypothetical protein